MIAADPRMVSRAADQRVPTLSPGPRLSIVVLAWDQLAYTRRCIESLRQNTDVAHELVIVDNGSASEAAAYAARAADLAILNPVNHGFSRGMNQGLAAARGEYVAFVNNDTVFPPTWASTLLAHFDHGSPGIVVPAVTNAGHSYTVRDSPAARVEVLRRFETIPSAVVYVMRRDLIDALGGWGEEYQVASAEDADLCFKVWANGRDVVFDQHVLIQHAGKVTASAKLEDWRSRWEVNRGVFLRKWAGDAIRVPRLDDCAPAVFERNLQIARSMARAMAICSRIPGGRSVPRLARMLSMAYEARRRLAVRRH